MGSEEQPSWVGNLERVSTRDELAARAVPHLTVGADPWLRWCLPQTLPAPAVLCQGIALIPRVGRFAGFWLRPIDGVSNVPERDRVRAALTALRALLPAGEDVRLSLPQEHASLAHEILPVRVPGGDWEWMWTNSAPSLPAAGRSSDALIDLDDRTDAAELRAFTTAHNPRVWAQIGTGALVHWVGVRDPSGELLAVGGAQREESGAPHLAGILTHQAHGGRGLGTRITGALTRWAIADSGVSTLGVFSNSATALRLYRRLGYQRAAAWHSVSVQRSR